MPRTKPWSETTETKGQSVTKMQICKYCGKEFHPFRHGGKGGRVREICLSPVCERKREQDNRQRRYAVLKKRREAKDES